MVNGIKKIKVICDDNREDKGRVCFWASEQILSKFNPNKYHFEFLNIADYLDKKPISSDYLVKHPAFAAFLIDKYNYQIEKEPYAGYLKKKIKGLNTKACDSQKKIYNALGNSEPLSDELTPLKISILLDLFGNTLDPLFLTTLFEKKNTDIIIVNWGAINNDTIYSSDRAFQFFSHYRMAFDLWVEAGGIFVLEVQSGQYVLSQDSYQLFETKIVTLKEEGPPCNKAKINTELRKEDHPVLEKIPDKIKLTDNDFDEWSSFPRKVYNEICQASMPDCTQNKIYQGWFEKYENEWDLYNWWEPLIYADENNKPIMLCSIKCKERPHGFAGAYILTTMYLGSSILGSPDVEQLIKNIFGLGTIDNSLLTYYNKKKEERIKEKEERIKEKEKKKKRLVIISVILVVLCYFGYRVLTTPVFYVFSITVLWMLYKVILNGISDGISGGISDGISKGMAKIIPKK